MTKKVDATPSWAFAAFVYGQVLQNPNASSENKKEAEADLIRLGQYVDKLQEELREQLKTEGENYE